MSRPLRGAVPTAALLVLTIALGCGESGDSVQSQNRPPDKARLDPLYGAPEDGSSDQLLSPVLAWSGSDADGDPLSFDVYLGPSDPPPLLTDSRITHCTVPAPLEYNTVYYWQVVTRDDHGHATVSDTWSFRTMLEPLACSATVSTTLGSIPLDIDFTGTGSHGDPPYKYLWYFGDGVISSQPNTSHTYTEPGLYTAVFKVTDVNGRTCSRAFLIDVDGPPVCSTVVHPTFGTPPVHVEFFAEAVGGTPPHEYRWDFGDGSTSTQAEDRHTYQYEGVYAARLRITDADFRSCTKTINIVVGPPLSCAASANPTGGRVPLSVRFSAEVSGGRGPYTYHWVFGDGGGSTTQNPSYVYGGPGAFTATLNVTDAAGTICTKSVRIVAY